ncbi:MAG: hypothetical protein Q7T71_17715 [Herbiconiux sp.]|nr:hypothetical protein [Herbiconiux sp.]
MTTATLTIGQHILELPEDEARTLFLAAGAASKIGAPIAISPHVTVLISHSTPISLTIPNGFADQYDPAGDMQRLTPRPKRAQKVTVLGE